MEPLLVPLESSLVHTCLLLNVRNTCAGVSLRCAFGDPTGHRCDNNLSSLIYFRRRSTKRKIICVTAVQRES